MRLASAVLWVGCSLIGASEDLKRQSLPEEIKRFEASWEKVVGYQARFTQTVHALRLGTTDVTTGMIYVRKPGRLRWEASDGTTQILNARQATLIKRSQRKKGRLVDIYKDGAKHLDSAAFTFLSGGKNFLRNYRALVLDSSPTVSRIRLTPQGANRESFIAEIDKSGYFLAALTTESFEARVRVEFSERQVNPALSDSLFEYVAEPDDVVHRQ